MLSGFANLGAAVAYACESDNAYPDSSGGDLRTSASDASAAPTSPTTRSGIAGSMLVMVPGADTGSPATIGPAGSPRRA